MVIDLFGLTSDEIRERYPEVYQHISVTVKPERDSNRRESFKQNWWRFGEPRKLFRSFSEGLSRYIATVETTKHRVFQFLDIGILPDHMLIAVGSDDAAILGILSSRIAEQFRRAKTTEKKVGEVLASLARLGYVTSEDGKTFALRRVA